LEVRVEVRVRPVCGVHLPWWTDTRRCADPNVNP